MPPEQDAEFVCAMEDVLDVYHRPYDEKRPLIALDESSKQLIGETVQPLPAEPGQPERFDYEYVRNDGPMRADSLANRKSSVADY